MLLALLAFINTYYWRQDYEREQSRFVLGVLGLQWNGLCLLFGGFFLMVQTHA